MSSEFARFWLTQGLPHPRGMTSQEASGQPPCDDDDPTTPKHGWQHLASQPVNAHFLGATVWPRLPDASRALLRSRTSGQRSFHLLSNCQAHQPLVSPSTLVQPCLPVWPSTRSLWLTPRSMCCGGGARESWVRSGVSSSTSVSRSGRVTTNVRIQDMDNVAPNRLDERRIEILADGPFREKKGWPRQSGSGRKAVPCQASLSRVSRVLLRRLWPSPHSSRNCQCHFDFRGHHRAGCAHFGVLGRRGIALEPAVAHVLDLPQDRPDLRRLEVAMVCLCTMVSSPT